MPEPGELVGPYRLVSQLGSGAMGVVWRARDERLDRYVALKVLPADAAGDLERRARMLREARAAAAIRHPNVVTLFDVVAHEGEDILVMELVEGRTLSETLRKSGPPPLETALRWIEGIADALVAAHACGVLHRDIKAANIMVTPDGVKVLDFGLAKLRDGDEPAAPGGPAPSASTTRLALDETMPSGTAVPSPSPSLSSSPSLAATRPSTLGLDRERDLDSYQTRAGSLLGTPLYMAPEQVEGQAPDERSEVFSVGVLAYEILRGRPPYAATTLDELFRHITDTPAPSLADVPGPVASIVLRALEKAPAARWPTMRALRDAVAAERERRFAPRARRWPLAVAAAIALAGAGAGTYAWQASRPAPARPGDAQVARALEEWNVFYNDKALSSLRAALAIAPDHPRANAYMILFGGASEADRTKAVAAARGATPRSTKDRALLEAALALVDHGPAAARDVLARARAKDRELAFWAAELDYRAGDYAAARERYRQLLDEPATSLRGRIYDHYSAVLLYVDEPAEAMRIGRLYRDAFPGEADAVGVYATTLAAAGKYPEAIAAADEARQLAEGEDTLAGLAKVLALAGDRARAKELYRRSLERAGVTRRPIRRAALALLQWLDGDAEGANATVAPCLPGGTESGVRERGACLFVAGVVDPDLAESAAAELDALAAQASATQPAYGEPAALARLVRARARFFGGACIAPPDGQRPPHAELDEAAYLAPVDFYAAYHVPYFATWPLCERAALAAARGDRARAVELLRPVVERAPHRTWLADTLASYR